MELQSRFPEDQNLQPVVNSLKSLFRVNLRVRVVLARRCPQPTMLVGILLLCSDSTLVIFLCLFVEPPVVFLLSCANFGAQGFPLHQ